MVVVLIILLATGVGGYFFYKKRTKRNVVTVEVDSDHQVLVKDDNLKDKLNELTEDPEVLFREFQQLETELCPSRNFDPDTAVIAEMNQPHNRYGDIGE